MNKVLHRQGYHLLAFVLIGGLLHVTLTSYADEQGRVWGFSTYQWTMTSWLLAGAHQGWVALFWRLELFRGAIHRRLGAAGSSWRRHRSSSGGCMASSPISG